MMAGDNFTPTLIVADCCPDKLPAPCLTESQEPPTVVAATALQFSVPLPVLLICNAWAGGGFCPATAVKERAAGVGLRPGAVGSPTLYVTGRDCVPACELKRMVPLYVPGCKPLLTAPTESVVGALPLVMLKESQEGALAIFQACEVVQAEESVRLTVSAVGSACW